MKIIARDVYKSWPEPMPMLLDSFAQYVYDPIPAIYVPAKLSMLQVAMQSVFRTNRNRGPNTIFITASISGGGKDDNSTEALDGITSDIMNKIDSSRMGDAQIISLFDPDDVDSSAQTQWLTSVVPAHKDKGGVLIIDTEAEGFYENIRQTGSAASNAKGIIKSEMQCYNGKKLGARVTQKKQTEAIRHPNVSSHRLCQTEIFHKSIDPWMVDKGYIPRAEIFYDDMKRKQKASSENSDHTPNPDSDYLDFILFATRKFGEMSGMEIEHIVKANIIGGPLAKFENEYLIPMIEEYPLDTDQWKAIKRVIITGEKLVTMIAAWVWAWKLYKSDNKSELEFNHTAGDYEEDIIPLLKILVDNKLHLLEELGTSEWAEVEEALSSLYEKIKGFDRAEIRDWTSKGLVPEKTFNAEIKRDKKLLCKLRNEDLEKFNRVMGGWLKKQDLIWKKVGGYDEQRKKDSKLSCLVPNTLENRSQ